jgi:hypothetical protein
MSNLQADQFVVAKYEPADEQSNLLIQGLVEAAFKDRPPRPTSEKKLRLAMGDFLAALQKSKTGLLAWQTKEEQFVDAAYKRTCAENLREQLIEIGWLEIAQKGKRGTCKLYRWTDKIALPDIKLRKYGSGDLVRVRGSRTTGPNGKPKKGKRLRIKDFQPAIQEQIDQMKVVNDMMAEHPLSDNDGTAWSSCHRGFNEGRLDKGGRIYGDWQNKKSHERLAMTVDGCPVVEVDIKGSFLFLGNRLSSHPSDLGLDPYLNIPFVRNAKRDEVRSSLRELAKIVVSSMWYAEKSLTRLPKGREKNGYGSTISLRQQFNLDNELRSDRIIKEIYDTFPFLVERELNGFDLMYRESQVILASMLDLAEKGIPTYPVHDCLICKETDQEAVKKAIKRQMMLQVGASPILEVKRSCMERAC